jgi:hypothetical protein
METRLFNVAISEQLHQRLSQVVGTKLNDSGESYAKAMQTAAEAAITGFLNDLEKDRKVARMPIIFDRTIKESMLYVAERFLAPGVIKLMWNDIKFMLLQGGETVVAFGCVSRSNSSSVSEQIDHRLGAIRPPTDSGVAPVPPE